MCLYCDYCGVPHQAERLLFIDDYITQVKLNSSRGTARGRQRALWLSPGTALTAVQAGLPAGEAGERLERELWLLGTKRHPQQLRSWIPMT